MTTHEVKSWTYLFRAIVEGKKRADIRDMTERDYRVGDCLYLREYDQAIGAYTGATASAKITHIISHDTPCAMSSVVLQKGYGILSIELLREDGKHDDA